MVLYSKRNIIELLYCKYWRSLPREKKKQTPCTNIHRNYKKKCCQQYVNLPFAESFVAVCPKTDHWQTDKTKTVTIICWDFVSFFDVVLVFLLIDLFIFCCYFTSNAARYFIPLVFCAVNKRKKQQQIFGIYQNQLDQIAAFFLSIYRYPCVAFTYSQYTKSTHKWTNNNSNNNKWKK